MRKRIIIGAINLYLLVGCTAIPQLSCTPSEERTINEMLYFGTAKPHGAVTSKEWEDFLRTSITPRFPKGFTFWQASGQWQNSGGTITLETSYIVNLVHPDDDRSENAVRSISREYKSRFKQEAVLRVKDYACMSF